jgi:putative MATE family efflux protein
MSPTQDAEVQAESGSLSYPRSDSPTLSLWPALKEALRGSTQDYTQGPLGHAILLLAVPMVLETSMESVFAIVDVFVVSRLGKDAVATVGLTEAMLLIVYALGMGLATGALAMVSRRIGEKDPERASVAAVQSVALGVLVSIPIGIGGVLFGAPLLKLMGASPGVLDVGSHNPQVILGGSLCVLLLFIINAVFRGVGDPAISMRVLWLANGVNLVLAPCLVFGVGPFPRMGVLGTAVGTTIGRSIGVGYQLYRLTRGDARVTVARRHWQLEWPTLVRILRLSGSAAAQFFIGTSSWLFLVRIVSSFGSAAVAGYTIAMRIVLFALLPSFGMANAAATLVGQSLGARRPERAESAVWLAGFFNVIFLGAVGAVLIVLGRPIVGAFTGQAEVGDAALQCLRIVSFGFLFYAYGMVLTQSFNGAGDTATPTAINLLCFWSYLSRGFSPNH